MGEESYEKRVKEYYNTMDRYALYDSNTKLFLDSINANYDFKKYILRYLKKNPNSTVFDGGFGTGRNMIIFSKYAKKVTGIDFTTKRVVEFKKKKKELKLKKLLIEEGDIRKTRFKDNSFDVTYTFSVLTNISPKDQLNSIEELHRITKKGGLCIINTLNKLNIISSLWYKYSVDCPQYYTSYHFMKKEIEKRGFKVKHVYSYNLMPNFFGTKDSKLNVKFLKQFGFNLYFVCEKK